MDECTVVVEWGRLKDYQEVFDLNGKDDYGVYQITGYHNMFGDDSLLYIGMARDQTFGVRFKQHRTWLEAEWGKTIYVGRVISIDDESEDVYHGNLWNSIIDDVEALLIYFHSPPYNSRSISDRPDPERKLRIINTGDCGDLYPEISHRGLEFYDNKPRPSDEN